MLPSITGNLPPNASWVSKYDLVTRARSLPLACGEGIVASED